MKCFFQCLCLVVITVIDFCMARHMVCDPDTNYQSLRLTWASKTNCNQRRGENKNTSSPPCVCVCVCLSHHFSLCQAGQGESLRATVTVWSLKTSGRMTSQTTWSQRCWWNHVLFFFSLLFHIFVHFTQNTFLPRCHPSLSAGSPGCYCAQSEVAGHGRPPIPPLQCSLTP